MPVCAPGYLDLLPKKPSREVLRDVRFIVSANFPDEWEEWTRAHGLEPPALNDLIVLDAMEQSLQLAENGHGLAMGRRPVVDDWLARGRLIAPFGDADPTGAAYYAFRGGVSCPPGVRSDLSTPSKLKRTLRLGLPAQVLTRVSPSLINGRRPPHRRARA